MQKEFQTLKIDRVPYALMTALRLTATRATPRMTLREYVLMVLKDNSTGPRKLAQRVKARRGE